MKLMTKAIEKKLAKFPLDSQDGKGLDAEVVVKYFNPCGRETWLITEGFKKEDGDWLLFGWHYIFEWEPGSILLSELEAVTVPFGLKIERDLYASGTVRENMR